MPARGRRTTGHAAGAVPARPRAALANTRGFESASGSVDQRRVAELRFALELTDDSDPLRRARLLSLLALELTFEATIDERRRLSDDAVRLSRPDPGTYASVL